MRSEKAVLYEQLLDTALCNCNWQAVPELVRKVKKHNLSRNALCEIVLAEYRLVKLIQSQDNAKIDEKILHLSFPKASDIFCVVNDDSVRDILIAISNFFNSLNIFHEKLYACILMGYLYFLTADYKRALDIISPYCDPSSISDSLGYCFFNMIKGFIIKGLSFECLSESSLAVETYQSVISVIEQVKQEKLFEKVLDWVDIAYYRCSLLLLKSKSYNLIKTGFLDNIVSRIRKSIYSTSVYRMYFRLLSELLNNNVLHDKTLTETSESKTNNFSQCLFSTLELKVFILKVQSIYESLLMQVVSFPKAGQLNSIILEYVDLVMQNWKNMGNDLDYAETIVDTIYNAISKTYKSHRLLRYLMDVLISLKNYGEARRTLKLYIELVERDRVSPFCKEILTRKNQLLEQDTGQDIDDDITIIETYVSGIKFHVVYYEDFESALVLVKKLLHALNKWEFSKNDKIMSDAWEAIGMAYSCQSIKTYEASERPSIQQNAIDAFQKSLEYISNKESTLYHLAFQYAEQREITDAILTIKHLVSQNYRPYQSLHLLSLLLSARGEYDQAIQICQAAIQISGVEIRENCSHLDYKDRESIVEIKITLCALLEAKDGIHVAIEMHKSLFNFYSKLFGMEFSSPVFSIPETKIPLEMVPSIVLGENKETIRKSFEERGLNYIHLQIKRYSSSQLSLLNASKRSVSLCSLNSRVNDLHASKMKNRRSLSYHSDLNISRVKLLTLDDEFQQKIPSFKPSESRCYYLKKEQKEITRRCLRKIWLISASLYCRASRWEESQLSIKEAEKYGMFHPDIHTQWGILYYHLNKMDDTARRFEWALLEDHDHINANIGLSKVFLEFQEGKNECYRYRAEQMLDTVTKLSGWDLSEAWLLLGEAWEKMNDLKNAKKAYLYAIELENTRPVRHWRNVSPRFIV